MIREDSKRQVGSRTLACVFAHPDDEAFSSGSTIAGYASAGVGCHLLCATDGDAGRSSGLHLERGAELGAVRRAELRRAAELLGFRSVCSLGLPDGRLAAVDADELTGQVVRFLRERRPQVVITFGPEGGPNAHVDHRAISRATTAAVFLAALPTAWPESLSDGRLAPHAVGRLYYVSWDPPAPGSREPHSVAVTARVGARRWEDVKRAAFEAHRSQHVLRDTFERLAMVDAECFALAAGVAQPRAVVEDLFEGI